MESQHPPFTGNLRNEGFWDFLKQYNSRSDLNFGISGLNKHIRLRPEQIMVIGGRPGEGKSMLAIQLMHEWARAGKKIVYFSNEMPKGEIMGRMISRIAEFPSNEIFDDQLGDRKPVLDLILEDINKLPIKIYDDLEGIDIVKVASILRRDCPDIFFLDHLQLVKKGNPMQKKHESLEEAIVTIKEILVATGMSAVILSQCNRGAIQRKYFIPDMADLKASGAIEENANTILLLSWPWYHQIHHSPEGTTSFPPEDFFIDIGKNRGGSVALCKAKIKPQFCKFSNREAI